MRIGANNRIVRVAFLAICASGVTATMAANSADSSEPVGPTGTAFLQEIVVTALKREQRASDVGMTIDTATGVQLKALGVTDISQLAQIAPGFTASTAYGGFPVYSIRGINFNAAQVGAAPAVSTYLDEAILPYTAMTSQLLYDVERVEVLKGPQGTLFGQNATGGSINVIAAKPTDHFATGANLEINNFGQTVVGAYVSGPISDTLRARLAATTTQFGAWQKGYDLEPNQTNGTQNKSAARVLLDWRPLDKLKIALNVNGNYDHSQSQTQQFIESVPIAGVPAAPAFDGYPVPTNARQAEYDPGFNSKNQNNFDQAVLRVDYDLAENLTLTSITDHTHLVFDIPADIDGTALPRATQNFGGGVKSLSQELRATGNAPSAHLDYIVGGNYQKDDITTNEILTLFQKYGLPPDASIGNNFYATNRAASIFANADYSASNRVTLTGGARYTSSKQTFEGCSSGNDVVTGIYNYISNLARAAEGLGPTNDFVAGQCITMDNVPPAPNVPASWLPDSLNVAQTESNVSWRGGANFKITPDNLLYFLISRGYKAGTFPGQAVPAASQIQPVRQEELTSYEIGTKAAFLQGAVRANIAAFYYDYKDKQFNSIIPTIAIGSVLTIVNIPKSSVKGVDADIVVTPTRDLTLRAGVTYIKTVILSDFPGYTNSSNVPIDLKGTTFDFAPPWSGNFNIEYRIPVTSQMHVYLGADGVVRSSAYANLGEAAVSRIPGYAVFDARAGVDSDKKWRAGLFIRNLTNKYYSTAIVTGADTYLRYAGLPLMYGVSVSYDF